MFPLVSEDLDDDDLADLATQIAVHYDDMFQLVSEELDANLATQIAVDYDDIIVSEDLEDDVLAQAIALGESITHCFLPSDLGNRGTITHFEV